RLVWADIEAFLRNPGELLERLRKRLELDGDEQQRREKELQRLRGLLEQKGAERDRVRAPFRRGGSDEATLDRPHAEIHTGTKGLTEEMEANVRALSAGDQKAQLNTAEALLKTLRKRLDQPISRELKRKIIETLVKGIQADTVERWGVKQSKITVTYRFAQPT